MEVDVVGTASEDVAAAEDDEALKDATQDLS